MSDEMIFADGIRFEEPSPKAPDFVIGKVSFKVDEAVAFLQKHENNGGWVNVQVLRSKKGNAYCKLDTWKPETDKAKQELNDPLDDDSIPF